MNRNKSLLTKMLLVLFLLTKLSIPLRAGAEVLSYADISPDKFTENGNEFRINHTSQARASIQFISKDKIVIDVLAEKKLGQVLISRNSDVYNQAMDLSFNPYSGNALSIRTASNLQDGQSTTISYKNTIVKLKSLDVKNGNITNLQQAQLETMFSNIKSDPTLSRLTIAAVPLLDVNSLMKEVSFSSDYYHVTDCAVEATDCLVAMVAYGMSMGALVSSCGFSFGAGCVAALLAHPILGGAVAIYCGRAIESCGLNR